jgi:two-component system, OmpR family, sensor histidine kinase MprB
LSLRHLSFRMRIALAGAAAVAIAVIAASAITYVVVRGELLGQFDDSLRARAASMHIGVADEKGTCRLLVPPPEFGGAATVVQLVQKNGEPCLDDDAAVTLPISDRDREIASGDSKGQYIRGATVADQHVRILSQPATNRFGTLVGALQIARPVGEVDDALDRIRTILISIAVAGVALAVLLGLVVASAALAPVRRLTRTAEEVTETRDLSRRIDEEGRDELARLASSFNTMLAALEASARSQRQLVSDASHELRTPLTSLRTNIEVLARDQQMPAGERESLLRDVTEQLEEMTVLVAELVELARGDKGPEEPEDVRLDLVTDDAIERTKRNYPGITVTADLEETLIHGVRATIERAISNLLDNAAKWSPPEGEVEVTLRGGELAVRDHGPGIAEEDVPFVFDRFYRAPSARSMPGSGLGLAIVRQVAESHGGSVTVETPEDGGTLLRLALPASSVVVTS